MYPQLTTNPCSCLQMHVLLRYYEARPDQTREARVKETLQTMGVSIMVGGFTTFLGVLPLVLSSLEIFLTVFYAFFAMVFLGVSHGLVLLPVILSYVGPTMCARGHHLASKPDLPGSPIPTSSTRTSQSKAATTDSSLPASEVDTSASANAEDTATPRTLAHSRTWTSDVTNEIEV